MSKAGSKSLKHACILSESNIMGIIHIYICIHVYTYLYIGYIQYTHAYLYTLSNILSMLYCNLMISNVRNIM